MLSWKVGTYAIQGKLAIVYVPHSNEIAAKWIARDLSGEGWEVLEECPPVQFKKQASQCKVVQCFLSNHNKTQ